MCVCLCVWTLALTLLAHTYEYKCFVYKIGACLVMCQRFVKTYVTFASIKTIIRFPVTSHFIEHLVLSLSSQMVKLSVHNVEDPGSIPGSGRALEEGNGNPLSTSLFGKSHTQSDVAMSPQAAESDTIEGLHLLSSL